MASARKAQVPSQLATPSSNAPAAVSRSALHLYFDERELVVVRVDDVVFHAGLSEVGHPCRQGGFSVAFGLEKRSAVGERNDDVVVRACANPLPPSARIAIESRAHIHCRSALLEFHAWVMMRPAVARASLRDTRRSRSRIGTASPPRSVGRTCGGARSRCHSPAGGSTRRSPGGRANPVHVVTRRKQRVVIARPQRALADKPEPAVAGLVELLVLIALVETDEPQARWSCTGVIDPGGTTRLNKQRLRSAARKRSHWPIPPPIPLSGASS